MHIDPFDQRYRLASSFYSLASGRYFLSLMATGNAWTGDLTETTADGTFDVTFDNSAPWDPQKIPLVLIHGLASSSEMWRELTPINCTSASPTGCCSGQRIGHAATDSPNGAVTKNALARSCAAFPASAAVFPTSDPALRGPAPLHARGARLRPSSRARSSYPEWRTAAATASCNPCMPNETS